MKSPRIVVALEQFELSRFRSGQTRRSNNSEKSWIDPITLEVIRHGLVSITDQIDANITRTAFSPYIYEYKDFAVGS